MANVYATLLPSKDADIIFLDGEDVYNCYLQPSVSNVSGAALDTLPVWRIEKIEKTEADGVVRYRRLFPNGNPAFGFVAADYKLYNYSFKQ